jgi:ligand-binding sensor domain-containing protein
MPELPVNIIVADPDHEGYLFVGTDAGVYFSENYGGKWVNIMSGLPNVAITAMKLHNPTRKLVIGTYGISAYSLNLDDIVAVAENTDATQIDFTYYPNPVQEKITIRSSKKITGVSIFDLNGRELRNFKIATESGSVSLNLTDLLPGTFLIRVDNKGTTSTRKFIKR